MILLRLPASTAKSHNPNELGALRQGVFIFPMELFQRKYPLFFLLSLQRTTYTELIYPGSSKNHILTYL